MGRPLGDHPRTQPSRRPPFQPAAGASVGAPARWVFQTWRGLAKQHIQDLHTKTVQSGGGWRRPDQIGWDAAGVVATVGPDLTLFQPGETVFYAGTIGRSGTNAEYHLVDERILGHKPETLDWAAAASSSESGA